jgi:hypothetical protein
MAKVIRRGKLVEEGEKTSSEMTLILTNDTDARAEDIIAWAEANPVPFATVQARFSAYQLSGVPVVPPPQGHMPVPEGFEVGYWHELHSRGFPLRRLWMTAPGEMPPAAAVQVMARLFRFVNPLVDCKVWLNKIDRRRYAVNVLEPVSGDWDTLKGALQ